jgi:hypothetical protein
MKEACILRNEADHGEVNSSKKVNVYSRLQRRSEPLSHARANPVKRGVRRLISLRIHEEGGNERVLHAWQLLCDSAANGVGRPFGHANLNGHEHRQYHSRTNRNSLEKVEKNRAYAHACIVRLSGWKREITMRIGLSCA